jgi:transcriptional regulator GlxA family with amidase domain
MTGPDDRIQVAIPLFDGFTALDAIGPYEVLQRIPSIDVVFVGHALGDVRSDNRMLGIVRDAVFEDVTAPHVLVFPGGFGTRALEGDERVLGWVRTVHRSTTYTTSVCTGALVLAAAGLLDGRTATTHWSTYAELERYGVTAVDQRVVEHLGDRLITAAGVSSGIDMALRLVELLVDRTAAEAAQLMIEYDPAPHVHSGSVAATSDETMTRVIEYASVGRH